MEVVLDRLFGVSGMSTCLSDLDFKLIFGWMCVRLLVGFPCKIFVLVKQMKWLNRGL